MKPRKRGTQVYTPGEQLFLDYLDRFSIKHERWPQPEGKQPDRLVHSPAGDVVCENKDIEWGSQEDELLNLTMSHGGTYAGVGAPPLAKSRKRIEDALDKLTAVDTDKPFVALLHNRSVLPHTNGGIIQQALYGPTEIRQLVGPEGALSEAWLGAKEDMGSQSDDREGFFGRPWSVRVSAVGVLWVHKPNEEKWVDFSYSTFCQVLASEDRSDQMMMDALEQKRIEFEALHGPKDLSLSRLALYHNPFATVQLPQAAFAFDPECYQMWFDRTINRFVYQGTSPASY